MKTKWNEKVYGDNTVYIDNQKIDFCEAIEYGLLDTWMASMRVRDRLTFDETFSKFRFTNFQSVQKTIINRIEKIKKLSENDLKKLLPQDDIEYYLEMSTFDKEMEAIKKFS